eukprot:1180791-Prorocentrum_minimum.AAC.5
MALRCLRDALTINLLTHSRIAPDPVQQRPVRPRGEGELRPHCRRLGQPLVALVALGGALGEELLCSHHLPDVARVHVEGERVVRHEQRPLHRHAEPHLHTPNHTRNLFYPICFTRAKRLIVPTHEFGKIRGAYVLTSPPVKVR